MPSDDALTSRGAVLMIVLLTTVSCAGLTSTTPGHPVAPNLTRTSASPPPASQPPAPQMEGSYKVVAGPPGTPPVMWTFTPCGPGCAQVEMGEQGSTQQGTARYVNVAWTLDVHTNGALQCGDGTHVPGTAHYSWNPDTLQGRYWSTADGGRPCGYEQSLDTLPVPLILTKAGA